MNNSKLYNMAAKIAVDKLVPKPIHITIAMQGGGGLSNLNENIVYRSNGGGFGFTEQDVEAMDEWQGYTDPGGTRTDDDTATVRPAGIGLRPIAPKVESLLPPIAKPPFYTPKQGREGFVDTATEDRIVARLKEGVPFHGLTPKEQEVASTMGLHPSGRGEPVYSEYQSYYPKYNREYNRSNVERGVKAPEGFFQLPPTQGGINQFGFIVFEKDILEGINERYRVASDPLLDQIISTSDSIAYGEIEKESGQALINELQDELEIIDNQQIKETQELERNIRDEKKNMSWGKLKYRNAASGGGVSSLNEKVVYRQGGGPPGTKLWNETDPDLPMAEHKVNHNGGLSLMMKGDDGRFYTRGGTDQRGLYYPAEVREQSVSDKSVDDEEDKDSVDPKGAKGPKPFPTSFEIQPPTTLPPPIASVERANVMRSKAIPSTIKKPIPLIPRFGTRSETGGETKPVKRNLFNRGLPQPVEDGERIGSPYPAYDSVLAQLELIERERQGGPPSVLPQYSYSQGVDPGPGVHDPRGIDPNYISYLEDLKQSRSKNAPVATDFYSEDVNYENVGDDSNWLGFGMKHGGGISSLNDSININGQPHRLVWVNPKEEKELKRQGGSGKKVLGKPAYYFDDPGYITDVDYTDVGGDITDVSDTYVEGLGFGGDPAYQDPSFDPSSQESSVDFGQTGPGFLGKKATVNDAKSLWMTQYIQSGRPRHDPVSQEPIDIEKEWQKAKNAPGGLEAIARGYQIGNPLGEQMRHAFSSMNKRIQASMNQYRDEVEGISGERELSRGALQNAVKEAGVENFEPYDGILPDWMPGWVKAVGGFFSRTVIGTGTVGGVGVHVHEDGTVTAISPEDSPGYDPSAHHEPGSEVPRRYRSKPVEQASISKTVEKEPSALERLLASRSEPSSLAQLDEAMQARLKPLYGGRNIFSEIG